MTVDITFYLFAGLGIFLLVVSAITLLFPAKKSNHLYGYRTDRSMRNRANWKFAQSMLPPMFLRLALYQFGIAGLWYFVPRQSEPISIAVFLVFLMLTMALEIFWSEKKLRAYSRNNKQ